MGYTVSSSYDALRGRITDVMPKAPKAGVDYPETWQEFESWFADDAACRTYLAKLRWPQGFVCPACGGGDAWQTGRGLWMCHPCGHQTSVTANTIFHRTRLPLRTWFAAVWFVCSQKTGASALGLQRVLGFGSYETAWAWMHKLRRAMVRPDRDQLGGPGIAVELDQTFIGGRSPLGRRGKYETKAEVAVAVERRRPRGLGRVRMRQIGKERKREIFDFAVVSIAPGTLLYTDGDRLYNDISSWIDLTHERIFVTGAADPAHELLPGVHRVASLLQRWLAGTLHYGQSNAHLDYYLDEFTFRFNRRTSDSRGLLFYRLLQQAVKTDPHPLKELVAAEPDYMKW